MGWPIVPPVPQGVTASLLTLLRKLLIFDPLFVKFSSGLGCSFYYKLVVMGGLYNSVNCVLRAFCSLSFCIFASQSSASFSCFRISLASLFGVYSSSNKLLNMGPKSFSLSFALFNSSISFLLIFKCALKPFCFLALTFLASSSTSISSSSSSSA